MNLHKKSNFSWGDWFEWQWLMQSEPGWNTLYAVGGEMDLQMHFSFHNEDFEMVKEMCQCFV